ncbi:histidine kinase [Pseudomonas capeferrum]|uniref:histidine kinase n=1 Tax=Pseudomonas capeferrum TaxID=1495066 RepID=UPI0015E3D6B1|nr:histidine kinase [Pseudomonas capeferrum]MBA1202087.1 histidine kinase [Pseudomonas capeferrum]
MPGTTLPGNVLQAFLNDTQGLLSRCQECVQHLVLIENDPDACQCLVETLDNLGLRARAHGLVEVASYTSRLQGLLGTACNRLRLHGRALPLLEACLTLLAWQLELVDPRTGCLDLDTHEQDMLLDELAVALDLPRSQARLSP